MARRWRACAAAAAVALALYGAGAARAASTEHGRAVFDAGGCFACHTDTKAGGAPLGGGAPLATPFGTFYPPNITPDPEHGIGRWSDADFLRAMHDGIGPTGAHYYPSFPYTTFTRARDSDLLDLKAYLFTRPPVAQANRPHDLQFPFSVRPLMWFWKLVNFRPGRWQDDPARSAEWNRGAYLVEALAHCGECHTPRNVMGGLDRGRWMAGARLGANSVAPNLTPHASGLANWSARDIAFALEAGMTPDDVPIGGEMGLVVTHGTGRMTPADRAAIATYLRELPPLPSAVARPAH